MKHNVVLSSSPDGGIGDEVCHLRLLCFVVGVVVKVTDNIE